MYDESSQVYRNPEANLLTGSGSWTTTEIVRPVNRLPDQGHRLFRQPQSGSVVSAKVSLTSSYPVETTPTFFEVKSFSPKLSYRNAETVAAYLRQHPEVKMFINAAWPTLVESFGGPVDLVLEVLVYPDESAHEEMVGWIQSTDDVEAGLEKFWRFENEWFLDHMDEIGDKFNFNIETK